MSESIATKSTRTKKAIASLELDVAAVEVVKVKKSSKKLAQDDGAPATAPEIEPTTSVNVKKPRASKKTSDTSRKATSKKFSDTVFQSLSSELQTSITQTGCEAVLEAFVGVLVGEVAKGNNITFTNYFTFKRVLRNAREHRNPHDKTPIYKDQHYVFAMDVKPHLKTLIEKVVVETVVAEAAIEGSISA